MCAILFLLLSKGLVLLKEHSVNVEDPPRQTTKPLPTPASNGIPGVGTHIRLRGLPWDVNEDAIIRFVKPVVEIRESDVCVCVGLNVRSFTFCQHSNFKHSQAVLSVVRNIGRNICGSWRNRGTRTLCLCAGRDFINDRRSLHFVPRGITAEYVGYFDAAAGWLALQKRVTGEAYVNVHTTEMRDMAVRMLHGRMMGARWIEVSGLTGYLPAGSGVHFAYCIEGVWERQSLARWMRTMILIGAPELN